MCPGRFHEARAGDNSPHGPERLFFSPRTKAVTTAWSQMIDFYLGGWGKANKAVFERCKDPSMD